MNTPNKHVADNLQSWSTHANVEDDKWVMGRPLGLQGLFIFTRIKLAWDVFRGRADALYWIKQ